MTLYTCEFPLPPRACSPNVKPGTRGAARGKWAATRLYRDKCGIMARVAVRETRLPLAASRAVLHLAFYYAPSRIGRRTIRDRLYRALDAANALSSVKALQDSLVDAGVLIADDHRHLSIGRVELYRRAEEHKGRCCVEVTLEVVE